MKIDGHDLYMVRGDDEEFTVSAAIENADGTTSDLEFTTADTITMNIGLWNGTKNKAPTTVSTVDDVTIDPETGAATIHIAPGDTSLLEYGAGKYVYSIKVVFGSDGTTKHLFPAAWFTLGCEV